MKGYVEVTLHSTEPSAVESVRRTFAALPGAGEDAFKEEGGRYYVREGFPIFAALEQGYVKSEIVTPQIIQSDRISAIGASMSDLVASVHALVTEGEEGKAIRQRLGEIRSTTFAILRHAEGIGECRGAIIKDKERITPPARRTGSEKWKDDDGAIDFLQIAQDTLQEHGGVIALPGVLAHELAMAFESGEGTCSACGERIRASSETRTNS